MVKIFLPIVILVIAGCASELSDRRLNSGPIERPSLLSLLRVPRPHLSSCDVAKAQAPTSVPFKEEYPDSTLSSSNNNVCGYKGDLPGPSHWTTTLKVLSALGRNELLRYEQDPCNCRPEWKPIRQTSLKKQQQHESH